LQNRKEGHHIRHCLGEVLQWVKAAEKANLERMKEQIEVFRSRITPAAVVTLLKIKLNDASHDSGLEKFRDGIFMPCVRSRDDGKKQDFVESVLEPLLLHSDKAVHVLEILSGQTFDELPELTFTSQIENMQNSRKSATALPPELWPLMFRAMRNQEHSPDFFSEACKLKCKLPFESSKKLRQMYIDDSAKETRGSLDKALLRHSDLLQSRDSRVKLFDHLISCDRGQIEMKFFPDNEGLLTLLYFTWWSAPSKTIPPELMPKPQIQGSWMLFQEITTMVIGNDLSEADAHASMCLLARFMIEPHTLPASILNTLKVSIVGGDAPVTSKTYALGQMEHKSFPVYGFRTHSRHLPKVCKDFLVQKCMGARALKGKGKSEGFPLTDRGVSEETVNHNLNILVHISSLRHGSQSQAQIFLPTLKWFEAAGFEREHLRKMCTEQEDRSQLNLNFEKMDSVCLSDFFAKSLVVQSLPVYVEVRFCNGGKDTRMFQNGQDSMALTKEWLAMLSEHYESCNLFNAPLEFEKCATRQPGAMSKILIIERLFRDIAAFLVKEEDRDMVDAVLPIVVSSPNPVL
jgi:hypothetical protein